MIFKYCTVQKHYPIATIMFILMTPVCIHIFIALYPFICFQLFLYCMLLSHCFYSHAMGIYGSSCSYTTSLAHRQLLAVFSCLLFSHYFYNHAMCISNLLSIIPLFSLYSYCCVHVWSLYYHRLTCQCYFSQGLIMRTTYQNIQH